MPALLQIRTRLRAPERHAAPSLCGLQRRHRLSGIIARSGVSPCQSVDIRESEQRNQRQTRCQPLKDASTESARIAAFQSRTKLHRLKSAINAAYSVTALTRRETITSTYGAIVNDNAGSAHSQNVRLGLSLPFSRPSTTIQRTLWRQKLSAFRCLSFGKLCVPAMSECENRT